MVAFNGRIISSKNVTIGGYEFPKEVGGFFEPLFCTGFVNTFIIT